VWLYRILKGGRGCGDGGMTRYNHFGFCGWYDTPALMFIDILCVMASMGISFLFCCNRPDCVYHILADSPYYLAVVAAVTVSVFYLFDLYFINKDFLRLHQVVNIWMAIGTLFLIMHFVSYFGATGTSLRCLFVYTAAMLVFVTAARVSYSRFSRKYLLKDAVIIAEAPLAGILFKLLHPDNAQGYKYGIRLLGYIAGKRGEGKSSYGLQCLGSIEDMDQILAARSPLVVIYAGDHFENDAVIEHLIRQKLQGAVLISAIGLYGEITGRIPYEYVSRTGLIDSCLRGSRYGGMKAVKRSFDIVLGAILLLASLPLIVFCALIVMLESEGPGFFTQKRIGMLGKPFTIYKLRTMTAGGEMDAPGGTPAGGEVTRFGRFLRGHYIDELPQFYNVLIGDMSIVGPRPEMETFAHKCEKLIPDYQWLRLSVRPGITGWGQVWHEHTTTNAGYRGKFEYDFYYLANASFRFDLEIIVLTAIKVIGALRRKNKILVKYRDSRKHSQAG